MKKILKIKVKKLLVHIAYDFILYKKADLIINRPVFLVLLKFCLIIPLICLFTYF